MIVDTSAVVAILTAEPERAAMLAAIDADSRVRMSAATYLEAAIVVDRLEDPVLSRRLDELLMELQVDVAPVDADQSRIARQAYRDFGKGSGHPAQLNFGDCFSYALAASVGEALLFKGRDFTHTDVRSALDA
ncbi:type II toxin-antitoxin system VapC family toxin [Occultella kanbiaonis]|uniref:type II toxin-antitoxin system VapC family toxin n=1 Tax=Occultella kanbiaonis TaxID=2675754 RepID=UPI0013D53D7C|nr:type II toxin-antitoxin system VapC family toxin [Occultella kanbiaonis]